MKLNTSSALHSLAAVLLAACLLTACGGGKSSGSATSRAVSSLPVANSSISQSNVSSSAQSTASSSSSLPTAITIQGHLANERLANAELTFFIGDWKFSAKADAQHHYRIDLPQVDNTIPVRIVARGIGDASHIEFATLLPSIAAMLPLAGSDLTLTDDEYFGVNISTITTAELALMRRVRSLLDTETARKNALWSLQDFNLFSLSGLLQYYATRPNSLLPTAVKTTLELAFDTDLAEAHINRLALGSDLFDSQLAVRNDAVQSNKKEALVPGRYFFTVPSTSTAVIEFNADGTGHLEMNANLLNKRLSAFGIIDAAFSWDKKADVIMLNFPALHVQKEKNSPVGNDSICAAEDSCELQVTSLSLSVWHKGEQATYLHQFAEFELIKNGATIELNDPFLAGILFNEKLLLQPSVEKLVAGEWHTNNYVYRFSKNGDASRTNVLTGAQDVVTWSLQDRHLALGNKDRDIWFLRDTVVGFSILQFDRQHPYAPVLEPQEMVQRQPLTLTENEWFFRWISYPETKNSNFFDLGSYQQWSWGFGSGIAGNWMETGAASISMRTDSWRYDRDLLATHLYVYYFRVCEGPLTPEYKTERCVLEQRSRSADFTHSVLWASASELFFTDKKTGDYWLFQPYQYLLGSADSAKLHRTTKISASRLLDVDSDSILELIYSSPQQINLCRYAADKSCAQGSVYELEPGISIKVNIKGDGTVHQKLPTDKEVVMRRVTPVFMLPKNIKQTFLLYPDAGANHTIAMAYGCGGTLVGLEYQIPALTGSCEIDIDFIASQAH